MNSYNLEVAKNDADTLLEEELFSIEAWVPLTQMNELDKLIKSFSVDYDVIKIEKKDREPTCIENKRFSKVGEDIIKIYDIPSTDDKDPSGWVLIAFALFFAMIVSDAGYGLIYLIFAIFLQLKIKNKKPDIARFIKLVFILAMSCIIWGVATSSFFGINFKPSSVVEKVSLTGYLVEKKANYHLKQKDDVYNEWQKKYSAVSEAKDGKDFLLKTKKEGKNKISYEAIDVFNRNILMEFSLLVGLLHIFVSFMRNLKRHIAGIGWALFMIGGYLYFPSILKATSMINFLGILPKANAYFIGYYLIFIGIILAVVLALIQKRVQGIKEITNIIGVFGDVLSYLRLYALGLAGMILSQTFNDIGMSFNLAIGIFVIIIGHGINIILVILGGVIHGLRLNFLEWYNHCIEGGGKLFNPLRLFK